MAEDEASIAEVEGAETEPDYKALYEQAQAEADRWKAASRKNEDRAKSNAEAARDYDETARQLSDATSQIEDLTKRLEAIEGENATLRASAARTSLIASVAQSTGVPESIVATLAGDDEETLTAHATAIAEMLKAPGGAPDLPEAGKFPGETGPADWLREALTNR